MTDFTPTILEGIEFQKMTETFYVSTYYTDWLLKNTFSILIIADSGAAKSKRINPVYECITAFCLSHAKYCALKDQINICKRIYTLYAKSSYVCSVQANKVTGIAHWDYLSTELSEVIKSALSESLQRPSHHMDSLTVTESALSESL